MQSQVQRLDEAGERLRRGLLDRAAQGREKLGQLRLSPTILQRNLREASQHLGSMRLGPALVTRSIAEGRERLDALARLAGQLHPEKPLSRGYAMVLDSTGKAVTNAAEAGRQASLGIKFADGTINVIPGENPRKSRKLVGSRSESSQPKLL